MIWVTNKLSVHFLIMKHERERPEIESFLVIMLTVIKTSRVLLERDKMNMVWWIGWYRWIDDRPTGSWRRSNNVFSSNRLVLNVSSFSIVPFSLLLLVWTFQHWQVLQWPVGHHWLISVTGFWMQVPLLQNGVLEHFQTWQVSLYYKALKKNSIDEDSFWTWKKKRGEKKNRLVTCQ